MKTVQTFCSFGQPVTRTKFGWYSAYFHLASWSLSAYTLSRYYDVTLYTDRAGYDILIEKLRLPYSDVVVSHDAVSETYNKSAWALAKLKTFALQSSSFLHVDGDVYLNQPFSRELLTSEIIVQNLELSTRKYERNLNSAKNHLRYLPLIMHPDIQRGDICSCSAGIIGGSNLEVFDELSRLAFAIADKNEINNLSRNVLLNVNVLLEQVMLYRLCVQQNKQPSCLFDQVYDDFGYSESNVADFDQPYIHLVGGHKRSKKTCVQMEQMLEDNFPDAHRRLSDLVPAKSSSVFSMSA